jgi:hypothetical protein
MKKLIKCLNKMDDVEMISAVNIKILIVDR